MDKLEVWKSYQNKYFKNNNPTPITNPNLSQIGSGDPNFQSSTQNIPQQPEIPVEPVPNNYSVTSYNEKITQNKAQIADIDAKLNNVLTRKDELKLIEINKISNSRNIVQTKTIQNSAYRELQATEDGLIAQKNLLEQEIQIAKDKIQQGGLDSQAGEQFSAGIGLDPVMDQDRIIPDVPIAPAMSPSERAQYFDKENTLLNPNFTVEDVAQGLTEQGASYLGGDNTILDKAKASPILDLQHGLSNPSEYELAKDYGYTNMDASAKEIAENPARFAGNILAEGAMAVAPVGMVLGAVGKSGKVLVKIGSNTKQLADGKSPIKTQQLDKYDQEIFNEKIINEQYRKDPRGQKFNQSFVTNKPDIDKAPAWMDSRTMENPKSPTNVVESEEFTRAKGQIFMEAFWRKKVTSELPPRSSQNFITKSTGTVPATAKEINEVEKLVMKAEMGKLNPDPKIVKQVQNEMKPFYEKNKLNPSGAVDMVDLKKLNQDKRYITNEKLQKIGKKIGTKFSNVPSGTYSNPQKYTGIGIGVGSGAFAFGQTKKNKKNKKSNNIFNFKY